MMERKPLSPLRKPRVLILVDEANIVSSVRALGRNLDWLKLREHFVASQPDHELIEMAVYIGLPPAMPEWQAERDRKNKFIHWLRSHGFLVVSKDGSPTEDGHYKANVDVMMAVDAVELSNSMQPDTVILTTGDADFACLAQQMRRRGIRVEAASVIQNLGSGLKSAVNDVIDLTPLFESFEVMKGREDLPH